MRVELDSILRQHQHPMRIAANIMLCLAIVASIAAMLLSVYPGVLQDMLFVGLLLTLMTSFVWLPIALNVGVALVIMLVRRKLRLADLPWRHVGGAAAILLCTFVLLLFCLPRRIAFLASRADFEREIAHVPVHEHGGTPFGRRIGLFEVEDYATDPRGGVFFRVYQGADGIGPDTMSYGFVHQPNQEGTPYGAVHYGRFRLGNGWYWFCASDDWF